MAFASFSGQRGSPPMADINMVPLIDVMLVLLVIFIITAPLMSSSLRLDLPKTTGATPTDAPVFVTVAVDAQGALFWGDEPVTASQLQEKVQDSARRNPATEVQLRADQAVPFGRIAELIGLVQAGGLNRVGFVTEGVTR